MAVTMYPASPVATQPLSHGMFSPPRPGRTVGQRCQKPERCQSGRMGLTRNQVYAQAYRGFESHPLRQFKKRAPQGVLFLGGRRGFVDEGSRFDKIAGRFWTLPQATPRRGEWPYPAANQSHPLRQFKKRAPQGVLFLGGRRGFVDEGSRFDKIAGRFWTLPQATPFSSYPSSISLCATVNCNHSSQAIQKAT